MARDLKCLEVSSMSPPISMDPFCDGSVFSSLHLPDHLHLLGFFLMVFVLFYPLEFELQKSILVLGFGCSHLSSACSRLAG
jgi:hypothetical protein